MKKIISLLVLICFFAEQSCFAQILPQVLPLYFSRPSFLIQDKFRPTHLRSIEFTPQHSGVQVLLDKGDSKELKQDILQEEAVKLMDYFLIGLTLPNDAFWVNLRPDQADNIIDTYLEKTDIGKVMLEADLNLKKDLAKATSPQTREGKEYWDKLYAKAQELFGDQQVSLPTFTRPWIVPAEIIVRQSKSSAYIYKATLKVMLEQDYLRGSAPRFEDKRMKELNDYSSELIRRLIIPGLVLKVNSSRAYAPLRQVYYSLILSRWLKEKVKNDPEAEWDAFPPSAIRNYIDKIDTRDLLGLISRQPWSKNAYFDQYKRSFQKGEYNESRIVNTPYGQIIRQYTSGGISMSPPVGSMNVIYCNRSFLNSNPAAVSVPVDGGKLASTLQKMMKEQDYYKLVELSRRLGLDPRPVEYKFLHPFYIAHDMAVKKIVNPESLPFNALYFGAGVDVVNLLLSTNAVQADFVSAYNGGLTKDRLDKLSDLDINTDAQNRKKAFDYRGSKYQAGYGVGLYVEDAEDYIIYLSTELEALGVDRSMIIADTDSRGYPRIAFDWAYPGEKPRKRYVCFIDSRDILQDRGIRYLGAYDLYYQRASVELAAGYVEKRLRKNSYIRDVYARVKPGGYLVTDDYSWRFSFERAVNYADDFPEDLAVEEHFVDPLLTDTVREFRKSEGYEKMLGYGWDVGIRRKPPPAENSRRSDGGQKEAVGKDIVSVTTGLDGGTIKNTSIDRTQEQVNRLDEVYNEMLKGINLFQDTSGEAHLYTKTIEREREIILLTVEHGSKKALDLVHPYLRESALQGKFNNPDEWILLLEGLSCFEIETAYLRKAISNSGIQIKNPIVAVDTKEVMEEAARLLGVDMNELYFRFINFVRPTMIPWSLEKILSYYAQKHGVNSEEMQNNFNIKKLEKKNETASQRAYYENEALQTLLVVSNKKSIDLIREQVGQKKYILIYCGMAHKQAIDNLFGENNWREITSSRKPTNIANALKLVPGVKGNLFYNDRLYLHFKAENPYRSVIFDENKLEILTIEPVSNDEVWIQAKVITSLNGEYGGVPVAKEGDVGWIKVTSDRSFNFTPDIAVQQLSKQSKDGGRLGGIDGSTDKRSPSIPQDGGKGGIDFRSLPIAIQPVLAIQPNLQVPLQPKIPLAELDKEWSSIQEMVNKGNIPSGEKIKEYVLSCCQKGDISQDMEKVLVCISQILRLEEDYAVACEPGFIQLLSILESDKPPHELQLALSAVSFGS